VVFVVLFSALRIDDRGLGAVAELERSLIVECVRAGLRNARAKGKKLGRSRMDVDAAKTGRLRQQGRFIREIANELGYSRSLVHKPSQIASLARCNCS